MTVDPQRVQSIFLAAVELPAVDRAGLLDRECGADQELRARVESLLEAHERSGSFLDKPWPEAPPTLDQTSAESPILERPGTVIGPYRLLQEIGHGGMGVVYMAEQTEPVRRRVALKIIRPGMDSRQVIARFEAERQALAMMDHPNIAKVLDAGTTDNGRPYFVMELVRGVPITQYCDEHQLTPRERLELFLPVCQAVQHAHQKGIIHRDLKPSNVLIALYDDRPVPKVIDFGVAKATSQRLTEKTMFTQFGQIVGTLEYMSPEQANLNQLDIDTRSDVYSLGVLLYELLTGVTPFDRQRLHSAAFDEMLRIIREDEPPRPSLRLSTLDTLPSVAANRHTEPKKLSLLVRGELDWIVMKALDKDRTSRYETANGFANDIQRYLNNEAVVACPPSVGYRFKKFSRRNKAVLSAAAVVLAALVIGIVGTTWQATRATREQNRAEVARREEAGQRAKAEQQRDRAIKAERLAEEQAAKAAAAAAKERQQRAEADRQRRLAELQELRARRNLYAAHMNLARDAWDNADLPRVLDFLERHVPAPGEPDWRSFEWYYLLGLCNRDELTIPCGHSSSRPAFSPDGRILAVAAFGTRIELWDLERRERVRTFEDAGVLGPLAFSPDGSMLASANPSFQNSTGSGEVKLWDLASGTCLRTFGGHRHHIAAIAFTADGKRIVSTDGGTLDSKNLPGVIRVWDVEPGERLHELSGHTRNLWSIAMSADGERLVSAAGGELRFWNLRTGEAKEDVTIPGFAGRIAWSPVGDLLANDQKRDITLWNGSTGEEVKRFPVPDLLHLAFSPDGKYLATAHFDSTVRVWDVKTGAERSIHKGHSQWVFFVTFSPDGKRIASVGRDCNVKVWPADDKHLTDGFRGSVSRTEAEPGRDRVAISPDGTVLAAMLSPTKLALMDIAAARPLATITADATVHAMAFSPEGDHLAVAHSRGLQIWDVHTAQLVRERPSDSAIWTCGFSPDGVLLAIGTDTRQVEICRADSLARQSVLPSKYESPLRKVAFSADGKTLGVATTGVPTQIEIWDVARWNLRAAWEYAIEENRRWATDLAFSRDGQIMAVSQGTHFQPRDGAVTELFDTATGRKLAALRGDDAYHTAVAFCSDGNTLATASEQGELTLWDLETREERVTFLWDTRTIESLAFSPDGRTLVSSDATAKVQLWRGSSQERIDARERAGWYRRAVEYISAGRWEKEIELCSQLLQRGEDPNMRYRRARALAELGRWNEAVTDFQQVADRDTRGFRIWYELAVARLAQDDRAGYRETCAKMLRTFCETTDPLTAQFVAWTCALQPQADLEWGQLIALAALPLADDEEGSQTLGTLGAVLVRAGCHEEALNSLGKALESTRSDFSITTPEYYFYFLAMAHGRLGQTEQARQWFAQADRAPQEVTVEKSADVEARTAAWFRRVTVRLLREEAQAVLDAPGHAEPGSQDFQETLKRALVLYSQAIQLQPQVPLLWRLRARVHEQLNQAAEAAADLARAERLGEEIALHRLNRLVGRGFGGGRAPHLIARAKYYFEEKKDYDAALRDCYLLLSGGRSTEGFQLHLAIHEARGTLAEAAEDWHREFGNVLGFYRMRATLHQQRGDYQEAIEDYGEVLKLKSDDAEAWRQRAVACIHAGQFEQAVQDATRAIELDPRAALSYAERAWAYNFLGRFQEAVADCDKAIRLDGNIYWSYPRRSHARRMLGDHEGAVADAKRGIAINPNLLNPYRELAAAYRELKQWDDAVAAYSEAIRISPQDADLYRQRAEVCLELRRYDEALADARTHVQLKPDDSLAALIHAQALLMAERPEEYRQACKEMVDRFGQSKKVGDPYFAARACVLAAQAVPDPMLPLDLAARAAARNPSTGDKLNTLGMAHLRAGQLDEAARRFHESLHSHADWPGSSLNWLGLALVHHAAGDAEQARECLGKGIQSMEQRPAAATQGRIQGQLLRREVERVLGESEEEKHGTESTKDPPVAEPKPTDTQAARSEASAAEPNSSAKPREKPE